MIEPFTEKERKRAKAALNRLGRIALARRRESCLWALKTIIERTLQSNVSDAARQILVVEMESAVRILKDR